MNRTWLSVSVVLSAASALLIDSAVEGAVVHEEPASSASQADKDLPADPQPEHKDVRTLLENWQRYARTDGRIPGALIGILSDKVKYFISLNKGDSEQGRDLSLKFEKLLPRFDASHDWSRADTVALLNDIANIHSIPLNTRFDTWPERIIPSGEPLPPQFARAAWGTPSPHGLRVAGILSRPRSSTPWAPR